eukprot:g19106.t1
MSNRPHQASEKANREILTTLSKTVKEGSEQIKRVSSTTMAMEEKVNGLTFDGDAFRQLRLEVEEAVQYLQAQCERVEQDCKDLDYRMSVQALAASTFSLKVVSMDAATREKSLKYLAGEEKRVKAKASPQTKAAMAARQTTSPRATAVAQRAEGPRPTGQVRSVSPDSTPQTSPRGPGPLNEERRETPGLAEALVSEVFCLEAAELSESERKMCVSLLKQRLAGLRSSTLNKEILEDRSRRSTRKHSDTPSMMRSSTCSSAAEKQPPLSGAMESAAARGSLTAHQRMLSDLWDAHCRYEFAEGHKSVENTMATMVEDAYVNHVPTMVGGFGQKDRHPLWTDRGAGPAALIRICGINCDEIGTTLKR